MTKNLCFLINCRHQPASTRVKRASRSMGLAILICLSCPLAYCCLVLTCYLLLHYYQPATSLSRLSILSSQLNFKLKIQDGTSAEIQSSKAVSAYHEYEQQYCRLRDRLCVRRPSPLPGVQSNEERRRMKQDLSRKKKKDVNEKRVLARKKHARKVVQSYGTPERTPSLSPDSKTKLMQRHGNFKTPRFDDRK